MSVRNILASAGGVKTAVEPEGIDMDGVNDYLSRSTDLVGEVSSTNQFTFAGWVYIGKPPATIPEVVLLNKSNQLVVTRDSSRRLNISIQNTNGDTGISAVSNTNSIIDDTWIFLAISINNTSTSTRKVYINDIPLTMSWTTYVTNYPLRTGSGGVTSISSNSGAKCRMCNWFFDYTYRDLSIEANRRIFTVDA